jgi:hypothetical protein
MMIMHDYTIAAICPVPSGFKIAFTDPNDSLIDCMEFGEEEIHQMMRFLTQQKFLHLDLRLVACPDDYWWTLSLVKTFEGYGHKLGWVDPELTRQVLRHSALWSKRRKFHNARTLGHIYRLSDNSPDLPESQVVASLWERKVAQETISECLSDLYIE